ncbi:MAG: PilN domain-containing protein [Burkholderiaceae bacterium]|nr:PilN domain-containing protein [Rhodoferax sp.]MCB2004780.1 PilN domain-containing protein [Rhodoferax sp.]MCB2030197.1 PilN domain-containing protein [Rhodoferax sp.]MCP5261389.1 PilN domain-containing protein [Rhodoferax sp.]MCW5642280.1 PilN domain-containing protein [Rhodoferax sp.]
MILINLLPHREAARKQRRDAFNVSIGVSFLVGGLIAGLIYMWFQGRITDQQGRNNMLTSEIKRLEGQIKDIAGLEAEIAALRARQQAVEDLQADRNVPVHLMTELVKQFPDGVYITNMKQDRQSVQLQGIAQSNERVSELLRNLANGTPWFSKPELVEIVASTVTLAPRDVKRVSNFTMRVQLTRASEAQKVAQAPAAPAKQ